MTSNDIDATRLTLALNELRLPAIKALWPRFAEQADKEAWRAARLLSALAEHELAERDRRRVERWSCPANVPVSQLIYAAFRSNAKGLLPPSDEWRRRGL